MATLTLHRIAMAQMLSGPRSDVTRHIRGLAGRTAQRSRQLASTKSKTGELASNIGVRPVRDFSGPSYEVFASAPHSLPVHEGSRPHIIRARNARSLHFNWQRMGNLETFVPRSGTRNGQSFITVKQGRAVLIIGKGFVNHPGNPPFPFLKQAMIETVRS